MVQRLGDIKRGGRSHQSSLDNNSVVPTLKDAVAGDLTYSLGYRTMTDILTFINAVDKVVPGFANDDNLLYGPEIKFFSNEIETDNNFKLKDHNIYFVGDGSGKAGNIVTAAATGLIAARDIVGK